MKRVVFYLSFLFIFFSCTSDERDVNVTSKVYMPQASYGDTYIVPNNGTNAQMNKNYEIDSVNHKLNIYLGVYRSGLSELKAFSVDIQPGTSAIKSTTLLPASYYILPANVAVAKGKREAYFFLSVDIEFLRNNKNTNFSLPVTISNVSLYEFNDKLTTTNVFIKTSLLLDKENL